MTQFWKYNYDTDNWIAAPAMRKIRVHQDSEPEVLWQELAACGTADPEDFEPEFSLGTRAKAVAVNEARFERASKICASCPVLELCKENSTPADSWYTYRAGEKPGIWTSYLRKGRVEYLTRTTRPEGECKNGHTGEWVIWSGRPKCKACEKDRKKAIRKSRAKAA